MRFCPADNPAFITGNFHEMSLQLLLRLLKAPTEASRGQYAVFFRQLLFFTFDA